jgi:putative DNA primase/helicase
MTILREEPEIDEDEDDYQPPLGSEDDIASDFAAQHADDLRYVASLDTWYCWDGQRWCEDNTNRVPHLARMACRRAAANHKRGESIASARTAAAVERLARTDPQLAARIEQFDADPWLLNTPGGVVDLKTGLLRPAAPTDYMSKITAVAPGGDCPQWLQFLAQIFPNDPKLIEYVQRALGYCLTGVTREHVLFFGHGPGQNGKGTLLNTIGNILSDYHTAAASETFTAMHSDRHPTELARLHGARLVSTGETQTGRHWNEARIKTLTGGDPVSARFMRKDEFTYTPKFKLFVTGKRSRRCTRLIWR